MFASVLYGTVPDWVQLSGISENQMREHNTLFWVSLVETDQTHHKRKVSTARRKSPTFLHGTPLQQREPPNNPMSTHETVCVVTPWRSSGRAGTASRAPLRASAEMFPSGVCSPLVQDAGQMTAE